MIILASASPRRSQLMSLITNDFVVVPSEVSEQTDLADPRAIVSELARRKAREVAKSHAEDLVIGADTVVCVDSEILGKPKDDRDAVRMIRQLQAKTHEVWTGICMIEEERELREESGSLVTFCEISEREAERYVHDEDVLDKAGAYAIQEGAAKFVERIDGSCTGVMGFPVALVYRMLKRTRFGSRI